MENLLTDIPLPSAGGIETQPTLQLLDEPVMQFSPDQVDAITMSADFMRNIQASFFSLVGPAGSGKTTIVKQILRVVGHTKWKPVLTAPTHKACANLRSIGEGEVRTLHSLLSCTIKRDDETGEESVKWNKEAFEPFDFYNVVLFIDEAGMVGKDLLAILMELSKQVPIKIIFIGDAAQLAPVGEDLSPVVDVKKCPWKIAELTTVHRQAADNPIIALATAVRRGEYSNLMMLPANNVEGKGVFVLPRDEFRERSREDCMEQGSGNHLLSFTNAFSNDVNNVIRCARYGLDTHEEAPYMEGELVISNERTTDMDENLLFGNNDEIIVERVTQVDRAFYELECINLDGVRVECRAMSSPSMRKGYLSYTAKIARSGQDRPRKDQIKNVPRKSWGWPKHYQEKDTIADLRPFHAFTVHKSQGSTLNNVYLNLTELGKAGFDPDMHRRLVYVALTRASNAVYLTV